MKKLIIVLSVFVLTILFIHSDASMPQTADVLRVRDRRIITFDRMMEEVAKVSVVFIGEIHDEESHHRDELEIIRAFHASDTTMAVGLEMFRQADQKMLDSWVAGDLRPEAFIRLYYDNWRLPWPLYRDILWYVREHRIPAVGLNIPDAVAEKIARQGFSSLAEEEKKGLPPGISCTVDRQYREFIRKAYTGHPRHEKEFSNFCEAQIVWDKSMAWRLIDYLNKNPRMTLVVLAGVGHAWKRGIPEQLSAGSAYTYRVIMPLVPDQIELKTLSIKDADYVLLR
jgi:uncharacterized iron-regulated protein